MLFFVYVVWIHGLCVPKGYSTKIIMWTEAFPRSFFSERMHQCDQWACGASCKSLECSLAFTLPSDSQPLFVNTVLVLHQQAQMLVGHPFEPVQARVVVAWLSETMVRVTHQQPQGEDGFDRDEVANCVYPGYVLFRSQYVPMLDKK